jgi:hypothetical protein
MPIGVRVSVVVRQRRLSWQSFMFIWIPEEELVELCLHTWASTRQQAWRGKSAVCITKLCSQRLVLCPESPSRRRLALLCGPSVGSSSAYL